MFIVFEGNDGVGKTTLINRLAEFLKENYQQSVEVIKAPSNLTRDIILNNDISDTVEALLFAADLKHVSDMVRKSLDEGKIVLCDRYLWSFEAYQYGGKQSISFDSVLRLRGIMQCEEPNVIFYLKGDVETCLARATDPNKFEKMGLEFHKKVSENYDQICERHWVWTRYSEKNKNQLFVLNADQPADKVAEDAVEIICGELNHGGTGVYCH